MTTAQLDLQESITRIPGVGETTARQLERLGVVTIEDLTTLLPRRLIDYSLTTPINRLPFKEEATIEGCVVKISSRRSKRGILIIEALVSDSTGEIRALWFNQRYILKLIKSEAIVRLHGFKQPNTALKHPLIVKRLVGEEKIELVYPGTAGLHQGRLKTLIKRALELIKKPDDVLPPLILKNCDLPTRYEGLKNAHQATNQRDIEVARRLLATEELISLALAIEETKKEQDKLSRPPLEPKIESLQKLVAGLPFSLTQGQRQASWEIIRRLSSQRPMTRILYGEVGSGKTLVALLAAQAVISAGGRAALLAPTVALADQHVQTAQEILGKNLVGKITGADRFGLDKPILIGTHALLKSQELQNFDLLITDEQHRFGVAQRTLICQNNPTAHVLMMTATPIPRSLAQTIFNYLEITVIKDRPAHQLPITTTVFTDEQRKEIEQAIRQRLEQGQPGYVVCPRIDEQESGDELFDSPLRNLTVERRYLESVFPKARVAVLHGRLSAKNKEEIVWRFRNGEFDILLSTTVVEVGLDNPKASWILVEEADYFGLAQLHQLRGRVGRGSIASVCFLHSRLETESAKKRSWALEKISDGLELASLDLTLRGPGDLLGLNQSGLPRLKQVDWSDLKTIQQMFQLARLIDETTLDNYPQLKEKIEQWRRDDQVARA